jgi:hypothetical protein
MQRRLDWSLRLFHISLIGLFLAGALAGLAIRWGWSDGAGLCNLAVVAAVLCAAGARVWTWWLRQRLRDVDFSAGAGYYRLEHLR